MALKRLKFKALRFLSGKNPGYRSFRQLGDAFGMEQDYLTGHQARNQLCAIADWKLIAFQGFYQSASCKVFTCSSRARTYSRSACSSACSFLIKPSNR